MDLFNYPPSFLSNLFNEYLSLSEICVLDTAYCNSSQRLNFNALLALPSSALHCEIELSEAYMKHSISRCQWMEKRRVKPQNFRVLFETCVGLHDLVYFSQQANETFTGVKILTLQYYCFYSSSGSHSSGVGFGDISYLLLKMISQICPQLTSLIVKYSKMPYYKAPDDICFQSLRSIYLVECQNCSVMLEDLLSMAPLCAKVVLEGIGPISQGPSHSKLMVKPVRPRNPSIISESVCELEFRKCDFVSVPSLLDVFATCPRATTLSLLHCNINEKQISALTQTFNQWIAVHLDTDERDEILCYNGVNALLRNCRGLQKLEVKGGLADTEEEDLVPIVWHNNTALKELSLNMYNAEYDVEFHDAWLKNILTAAPNLSTVTLNYETELNVCDYCRNVKCIVLDDDLYCERS